MDTLLPIIAVASVHLAAVMAPGPNFLVIVKNSLMYSRHTGLLTARGVAIGTIIHVTAGFLGFTVLVSQSVVLFNLIKWFGVAYFLYNGVKSLRAGINASTLTEIDPTGRDLTSTQAIRNGLLTMLSNVKAAFYFLILFTTFMPIGVSLSGKIAITLLLASISLTWYTIVAFAFSDRRIRSLYRRFERWMNAAFGFLWIGLGWKLATVNQD